MTAPRDVDRGILARERAALRRLGTLAGSAAPRVVFEAMAEEISRLAYPHDDGGLAMAAIVRYDGDEAVVLAAVGEGPAPPALVDSRWPLNGDSATARVHRTGRPARIDGYAGPPNAISRRAEALGIRSTVSVPIVVGGRLWGGATVMSDRDEPLPPDTEARLSDFAELAASAVSNADAQEQVRRMADEQAALRRVATLVAEGTAPEEVFEAVADEVRALLGADSAGLARFEDDGTLSCPSQWSLAGGERVAFPGRHAIVPGSVAAKVVEAGAPARVADWSPAPGPVAELARERLRTRHAVASPIEVDGRAWGLLVMHSALEQPPPADTEDRLANFAQLVATAVSNAEARVRARRIADEQEALRRTATLVAEGVGSDELLSTVSEIVGRLFDADSAGLARFEADGTMSGPAHWSATDGRVEFEGRFEIPPGGIAAQVLATGEPARVDDYDPIPGEVGEVVREVLHARRSVAGPILVDGRLWGLLGLYSQRDDWPPPDTESRLADFTDLVAIAIANEETRAKVRSLAHEQSALRRVATLVAEEADADVLSRAVSTELRRLPGVDAATIVRFESSTTFRVVAADSETGDRHATAGTVWPLEPGSLSERIRMSGRAERIDRWEGRPSRVADTVRERLRLQTSVGCPIVVDGELWGAVLVHSTDDDPLPQETTGRLASVAELLSTAMSNARAHLDVERLAAEQTALRRVATLVARQASADAVFASVVEELGQVLGTDDCRLVRFNDDETVTQVAGWGHLAERMPDGTTLPVGGHNVTTIVRDTGRPARIDDYREADGPLGDAVAPYGLGSVVGCPVMVAGRPWGATVASMVGDEPLPTGTEQRMLDFTDLVATAIANIEARTALDASRARIVAAADEARRRVERDLHDGAQQRLVSLALELRTAEAMTPPELEPVRRAVGGVADGLNEVLDELRELSRGIHPAVLSEAGLGAALRSLARRSAVPVRIVSELSGRLDEPVEVTAYYVVSEALANAAKHADAREVSIAVAIVEGDRPAVELVVHDDGVGGAQPSRGSGLMGIIDRVEALGGTLALDSPPGTGTTLRVTLPMSVSDARVPPAGWVNRYRQAGARRWALTGQTALPPCSTMLT